MLSGSSLAVEAFPNIGVAERDAVFTRSEVVNFILDLSGYTTDKQLHNLRLLEPSFGGGNFLLPAIERLLMSWEAAGKPEPFQSLVECIRAVELHSKLFERTKSLVLNKLILSGISLDTSNSLVTKWLVQGDFLLTDLDGKFDIVVANPPYIRQELVSDSLIVKYRQRFKTIYDRADIYVPFIEHSLNYLIKGGTLGMICSDRWMKNRYGGPLRDFVSSHFNLKIYVDMVDTSAFDSDVIAYPAITIISREKQSFTRIAYRPEISESNLSNLKQLMTSNKFVGSGTAALEIQDVVVGAEPWILDSLDELALIRKLEQRFPTLEEAGCKVSIGVATGADDAFIAPYKTLDVEQDRKLPLVMTRDILSGSVQWRGFGVINPFSETGGLVNLVEYPRLKRYLEERREVISNRHIAKKTPINWYRTIDRIYPSLVNREKLLIPDIKGKAHIVYDEGHFYPHHNLYVVTSDTWDLRALQAVLLSGIARLFVSVYSTKMRGGYLRFQAQYLRRIRIPYWSNVPQEIRAALIKAATRGSTYECNQAVCKLYEFTADDSKLLKYSEK